MELDIRLLITVLVLYMAQALWCCMGIDILAPIEMDLLPMIFRIPVSIFHLHVTSYFFFVIHSLGMSVLSRD